MGAEGGRKNAGGYRRDDAVDIGDAGAHRDQREHVEIARDDRLPSAHEERPAGPQHHRCRKRELDPVREPLIDEAVPADDVRAHLQRENRQRSARARSRSAGSCRRVRDWGRCRRSQAPAPAPSRRSGRSRGRPAGSRDASGRCRSCLPARARRRVRSCRDISPDRRRISCGSLPSRNDRCGRDARVDAGVVCGSTVMPQTGSMTPFAGRVVVFVMVCGVGHISSCLNYIPHGGI